MTVPSAQGQSSIIASVNFGDETRAHLDGGFKWDEADGLGVFTAAKKYSANETTNAYFGYEGQTENNKAKFKGDLQQVKGTEFFAYYPWTYNKSISTKNVLAMTIPSTQHYNHANDGSFALNTVPLVGYNKLELEEDQTKATAKAEFEFEPVVSYVRIPVKGIGQVDKIALKIRNNGTKEEKGADGDYLQLYGTVNVTLTTPAEEEEVADAEETEEDVNPNDYPAFISEIVLANSTTATTITMQCGDGVMLERDVAKNFLFVIPADIVLNGTVAFEVTINGQTAKTITKTATFSEETYPDGYKVKRNGILPVPVLEWNDGGKVLIDNTEQLVEYLYLATYGWDAEVCGTTEVDEPATEEQKAAAAAVKAEKDFYFDGANLRAAVIMKDLKFDGNTKYEQNWQKSGHAAESAFVQDVYRKFNTEGENFAITSVGGKLAFNIENGTANESVTIDGLAFAGSIFNGTQVKTSTVKDVTFVNTTVNGDYFIAKTYGVTNLTLTNVTTGEGCVLVPATEGKGAFVDAFDTKNGEPVETILPTFDGKENIKYANTLTVTKPANYENDIFVVALDKAVAKEGELHVNTTDYNAITTATAGTLYVVAAGTDADGKTVSVANVAKALIQNENFKVASKVWHSVVTRDSKFNVTASYWTGTAATAVNEDGVFTAEELAYVVTSRATAEEPYKLTCNLTLTYKDWVKTAVATTGVISIDGNKKTITGAQIKATNTTAYNYTVFGYAANLKNITVNSTTIDFGTIAVPSTANVAVLAAEPGTEGIEGVTVGTPTIKVPAAAKVTTVGGMFAKANATQWAVINGKDVVNKITTTATTTSTKNIANGAKFGSVVGKLNVAATDKFTKTVTTDAVNKIIGVVDFSGITSDDDQNTPKEVHANFLEFGEGQYPTVSTVLPENGVKGGFIHKVYVYNGTDKTGADVANFFWYPEASKWVAVAE